MRHSTFILRRLAAQVFVLLGLSVFTYDLLFLLPGDPAAALLTMQGVTPDQQTLREFRQQWGLDRPIYEQYLAYLGNVLHGNLGTSMVTKRPISDSLLDFFPA